MRILIACENSGVVRDAFRAKGHEAYSCDLLPAAPGTNDAYHIVGDALQVMNEQPWDMMIAHPPCTYLSSSGLHWNKRGKMVNGRPRAELTEEALLFVLQVMCAPIPKIAIENPMGCISTRIDASKYGFATAGATQYIQPYDFGEDASKKTGLWLKGLPKLQGTQRIPGRVVDYRANGQPVERWSNQTDSGQNKLGPSEDRWSVRSKTYQGIADAMANQWG